LASVQGCHAPKFSNPQAAYTDIQNQIMRGNLAQAEQQIQEIQNSSYSHTSPWNWKFRLLQANLSLLQGHNAEVLKLLVDSDPSGVPADISIQRELLCAVAYARTEQMDQANLALQKAVLLSNSNHSLMAADILRTSGVLDVERSDFHHASEMFHRCLETARQDNDSHMQASALLNLGVVALRQEHFDEALDWSNLAADKARSIGEQLIQEKSQGNVAYANYSLGNFEEALDRFREARVEARKLGSQDDEIEWLNDQGLSLYQLGDHVQAESCYKGALQIAERIKRRSKTIEANIALASLYLQLGKLDEANKYDDIALALSHTDNRALDEADALFMKSAILIRQSKFEAARKILADLEQQSSLEPSQRWRVEGALANLYTGEDNAASADKWYRQSITTFETQRETIKKEESKLPFSTNADRLYDDYVRFLVNHNKTNEALQWLDLGRARTLEEGLGIASPDFTASIRKPIDVPAIARRLHGTILVYTLAPRESYLWAVNSAGTHFFKLPPQDEIDAHVKNYQRTILASRDPLSDAYADGIELYKTLIAPAASLIPKGSPVFIIPDGSISRLNFETLLAPGGGVHYWIEDATITNASSLKLLAAFHPERHEKSAKKLLLIGDPVSPDEKFPALPNASAEVTDVAKHFPAGDEGIFIQRRAVPSAYTDGSPGDYSLIHFVAHGTSSSASPLDSAIVLTRNPANPDLFKLYARDIIHHALHADLVAISACYGSGSRIYGGEGLVGLSWAFLRAGAHYVIGSLWEVSDSAAPQIMDTMYGEIAAGRSPDAALRDAKLSMVHSQGIFRKPLYWATFQLYGGA